MKSPVSINLLKKSYLSSPTTSILNSSCISPFKSRILTKLNLPIFLAKIILPAILTSVVPSSNSFASSKECVFTYFSGYGLHTFLISSNFSLLTVSCSEKVLIIYLLIFLNYFSTSHNIMKTTTIFTEKYHH